MKKRCVLVCIAVLVQFVVAGSPVRAEDGFSFEDELEALTRAMTRLVDTLERQAHTQAVDQDLSRLRVAVSILDIRARRYEALQRELRNLEDSEEYATGYIATTESKIEKARERIAEATDDSQAEELRVERDDLVINLERLKSRLEHTRRRQLDVQNQLLDQQRLVRDVEAVVDGWLLGFQLGAEAPANQ